MGQPAIVTTIDVQYLERALGCYAVTFTGLETDAAAPDSTGHEPPFEPCAPQPDNEITKGGHSLQPSFSDKRGSLAFRHTCAGRVRRP